jgi:SAM-dependent methyltransferase
MENINNSRNNNNPQEEYVQSLESRLSERSNLLEEKHMEAAIDAELIHAPCCSSNVATIRRQTEDGTADDDDDNNNSTKTPVDYNNISSHHEANKKQPPKPIFDNYTNPNSVSNCLSPYVPTSAERIAALIQFVNLNDDDVLLDIGCGDGRVCIAATKLTGATATAAATGGGGAAARRCRSIGLDVSPLCINMARQVAREEGLADRVEFYQTDATVDPKVLLSSGSGIDDDNDHHHHALLALSKALQSATVVYLYTYPTLLLRLTPLLSQLVHNHQVRAIVTLTYHLPETTAKPDSIHVEHNFRLYTKLGIPAPISSSSSSSCICSPVYYATVS